METFLRAHSARINMQRGLTNSKKVIFIRESLGICWSMGRDSGIRLNGVVMTGNFKMVIFMVRVFCNSLIELFMMENLSMDYIMDVGSLQMPMATKLLVTSSGVEPAA